MAEELTTSTEYESVSPTEAAAEEEVSEPIDLSPNGQEGMLVKKIIRKGTGKILLVMFVLSNTNCVFKVRQLQAMATRCMFIMLAA